MGTPFSADDVAHGGMKLICTVHGPRALPRSGPFSPHLVLATHVKFAPFATQHRRGYLRDSSERDLGVHLEAALRGAILADRWPKSAVDVVVTIIETNHNTIGNDPSIQESWDLVHSLSACITVASAAIMDAGIDCVGSVCGGAAVLVSRAAGEVEPETVPLSSRPGNILAACCVAYIPARDELTTLWTKGQLSPSYSAHYTALTATAVQAARATQIPLIDSITEII